MSAGGAQVCLEPGVHTFLIEHLSGDRARVDYVEFVLMDSPVERSTWGAIKHMYR